MASFSRFIFSRASAALCYIFLTAGFFVFFITLWSRFVHTYSDAPVRHFGTGVSHLVLVFSLSLLCMSQYNLLISMSSSLPASRARFPRFGLPERSTTKTYPKPINFHIPGPPGLQGQISSIWLPSTKYYENLS